MAHLNEVAVTQPSEHLLCPLLSGDLPSDLMPEGPALTRVLSPSEEEEEPEACKTRLCFLHRRFH